MIGTKMSLMISRRILFEMVDTALNKNIISNVMNESTEMLRKLMGNDLKKVILYGSCARGDFGDDSDIDIALLTNCNRIEAKKYDRQLSEIAADMAMKYFAVVNFACLPFNEFTEKKNWYAYFRNIENDGEVIYG